MSSDATYESLPLERLKTEAERWIPFIAEERGAVPDAFGNASRGLRDIVQRAFDLGASGAPSAVARNEIIEECERAFYHLRDQANPCTEELWDATRRALKNAAPQDTSGSGTFHRLSQGGNAPAVAAPVASSTEERIDLTRFINAANISAADVPHVVVEKLQKAIDASSSIRHCEAANRVPSSTRTSDDKAWTRFEQALNEITWFRKHIGSFNSEPSKGTWEDVFDRDIAEIHEAAKALLAPSATKDYWQHAPVACHRLGIDFMSLRAECERIANGKG